MKQHTETHKDTELSQTSIGPKQSMPTNEIILDIFGDGFNEMIRERMEKITSCKEKIDEFLDDLQKHQTNMMQHYETDFVNAYKEHMMRVQCELIQFQKKSTEFYFTVKKSEKIQHLDKTIEWLRSESISLGHVNETLL